MYSTITFIPRDIVSNVSLEDLEHNCDFVIIGSYLHGHHASSSHLCTLCHLESINDFDEFYNEFYNTVVLNSSKLELIEKLLVYLSGLQ